MLDLTPENLEQIISMGIGKTVYRQTPKAIAYKDEVLSCLYFRISRILDNQDKIDHGLLITVCDNAFKQFELHIEYDKNKFPDSTLRQFRYIVNKLLSIKDLEIDSAAEKMSANKMPGIKE